MKQTYILLILSALIISGVSVSFAQKPDTLLNVVNPSRVVVTEEPKGVSITVKGKPGDSDFISTVKVNYPEESMVKSRQSTFLKKVGGIFGEPLTVNTRCNCGSKWDIIVDGVCLGLTNSTGFNESYGPEWSKSIEIGWLSCLGVGVFNKNYGFTLGIGFDWRNYKVTTSNKQLTVNADRGLALIDYPSGSRPKNSRLKVFSLQFPLLYRLSIPKTSLKVNIGPIFNFNTYASVKTIFINSEGTKISNFSKDIDQRLFTVDFFGSVSVSNTVGVYVRYSPMKVIDAAHSLNMRPLTIGIGIGI